jgi:hypothetical protein
VGISEPLWRHRNIWGKHWDLKETGIEDIVWSELTQDRVWWRRLVKELIDIREQ